MEWGTEGYHLWLISQTEPQGTENGETEENAKDKATKPVGKQRKLLQLQFVKSALTVNPCTVSLINYLFYLT